MYDVRRAIVFYPLISYVLYILDELGLGNVWTENHSVLLLLLFSFLAPP